MALSTRQPHARSAAALPSALDGRASAPITRAIADRRLAVFLDYDGTLTPIVERPELATLPDAVRSTVGRLAELCSVAIISGRDLRDLRRLVGLETVCYAGSHGFEIAGPAGRDLRHAGAESFAHALRGAETELRERLAAIPAALVESKKYGVAVHYRLATRGAAAAAREAVSAVAAHYPNLVVTRGKKVLELRPRLDWDKGKAVLWLLEALHLDGTDVVSVYIGDDVTDEDAFAAIRGRGIGILVAAEFQPTDAQYLLHDPSEVRAFLQGLIQALQRTNPPSRPVDVGMPPSR